MQFKELALHDVKSALACCEGAPGRAELEEILQSLQSRNGAFTDAKNIEYAETILRIGTGWNRGPMKRLFEWAQRVREASIERGVQLAFAEYPGPTL